MPTVMIDTVLVDRGPGETRVAALAGDQIVEIYYHRHNQPNAGALYRGRVGKPLAGSGSVFVDIGLSRPALMRCGGAPPPEGQSIDVRVVQPPRYGKGAKVSIADADIVGQLISRLQKEPNPPVCLLPSEHPVSTCLNFYAESLKRVLVSPNDSGGEIASLLNNAEGIIIQSCSEDLFADYGVTEAIEVALDSVVDIKGGGRLHIEPTAALIAVDVDAGPMTPMAANTAAIDQLAHELRFRALAGPVIVDLIPAKGRSKLVQRMKDAVASDPVPTRISGLTPEGRLELNRRRTRPSLAETLLAPEGTHSHSVEAVAYQALRHCVRTGLKSGAARVHLSAHSTIIELLRGDLRSALDEAEFNLKSAVVLQVKSSVPMTYIDVVAA